MYSETSYPFADYVGFSLCDFYFQLLVVAIAWKKKPGHSNKKMLKEIVESEDDDESIRAVTIYRDRSEESSRERKKERKKTLSWNGTAAGNIFLPKIKSRLLCPLFFFNHNRSFGLLTFHIKHGKNHLNTCR